VEGLYISVMETMSHSSTKASNVKSNNVQLRCFIKSSSNVVVNSESSIENRTATAQVLASLTPKVINDSVTFVEGDREYKSSV